MQQRLDQIVHYFFIAANSPFGWLILVAIAVLAIWIVNNVGGNKR